MNPHGRIPVVVDGNATIWESNSVVRYLAAAYGPRTLWCADPAERSLADRWMDWELATLQPAFMNLFWGFYRTPEMKRDLQRVERARELCGYLYGLLDAELAKRPFLAGDAFTVGDVPVATTLFRYFEMGIDVPALPNVRAWYERLAERPAYREHIMIPFEELRGKMTV